VRTTGNTGFPNYRHHWVPKLQATLGSQTTSNTGFPNYRQRWGSQTTGNTGFPNYRQHWVPKLQATLGSQTKSALMRGFTWTLKYLFSFLPFSTLFLFNCFLKRIPAQHGNLEKVKENRIYIREEFTRKKCKTAILLYCFHTAGVLRIFVLFNLLGPGTSFYRKSKINIKRKPNYEITGFIIEQWSFHTGSIPFTLQTMIFRYHYKSNDVFLFT